MEQGQTVTVGSLLVTRTELLFHAELIILLTVNVQDGPIK